MTTDAASAESLLSIISASDSALVALLQQQQGHTVLQLPRGESRHSDREVLRTRSLLCVPLHSQSHTLTPFARAAKPA